MNYFVFATDLSNNQPFDDLQIDNFYRSVIKRLSESLDAFLLSSILRDENSEIVYSEAVYTVTGAAKQDNTVVIFTPSGTVTVLPQ